MYEWSQEPSLIFATRSTCFVESIFVLCRCREGGVTLIFTEGHVSLVVGLKGPHVQKLHLNLVLDKRLLCIQVIGNEG